MSEKGKKDDKLAIGKCIHSYVCVQVRIFQSSSFYNFNLYEISGNY